ncbi:MAG: FAD-dependent oxidoreductase [Acidobacteriota bacterium]
MIERNPALFSRDSYDLLIIGGGIYGACLSLEASRRGLSSLVLERDDFGGATSWNSLRILHGGLRYLQHLDLKRFRESVAERRWFSFWFPELVRPLPCLMPLYGRGLKRKVLFGPALRLNDFLSSRRNAGVSDAVRLPDGRILSVRETAGMFPLVKKERLEGAALWHDTVMLSPQRVLMEILRWACLLGGRALNYVEAEKLLTQQGRVVGVGARDRLTKDPIEFRANTVINCAGPWSRELAAGFDRDVPSIFFPSLAFNVFVEHEPPCPLALAVQPARPGAPVYFMHPCQGGLFLGTVHAEWNKPVSAPDVEESALVHLIDDINDAVPGLHLQRSEIGRVFAGLLPAAGAGSDKISRRPAMHVHASEGGPRGLISICGVKFTTARLVAELALGAANSSWRSIPYGPSTDRPPQSRGELDLTSPEGFLSASEAETRKETTRIVQSEAVTCMGDLIMRRTDWGLNPKHWQPLLQHVHRLHPEMAKAHADPRVA